MARQSLPNLDSFGSSLRAILNNHGEVVEGNDKFNGYFPNNVYSIEDLIKDKNTSFQWKDVVDQTKDDAYSLQITDEEQGKKIFLKINISRLTDSDMYVFEAVDLSEETEAIDALKHIITTNNAVIHEDYFKILGSELAKLMPSIRYILIGKLDESKQYLNTIAFSNAGEMKPNFNYEIKESPFLNVLDKGKCIFSHDVQTVFPKDKNLKGLSVQGFVGVPINNSTGEITGIVAGFSDSPIKRASYVGNVMDAFSVKAGVEFDRIKQNSIIENVKKRLDQKVSKMEMQHCLMSELSSSSDIQEGDIWPFSMKLTKLVSQKLNISRVSVWMLNDELTKGRNSCIYDLSSDRYTEEDKKLKDIFEKEFDNFIKLPYLDSNELADVSFLTPYVSNYL